MVWSLCPARFLFSSLHKEEARNGTFELGTVIPRLDKIEVPRGLLIEDAPVYTHRNLLSGSAVHVNNPDAAPAPLGFTVEALKDPLTVPTIIWEGGRYQLRGRLLPGERLEIAAAGATQDTNTGFLAHARWHHQAKGLVPSYTEPPARTSSCTRSRRPTNSPGPPGRR